LGRPGWLVARARAEISLLLFVLISARYAHFCSVRSFSCLILAHGPGALRVTPIRSGLPEARDGPISIFAATAGAGCSGSFQSPLSLFVFYVRFVVGYFCIRTGLRRRPATALLLYSSSLDGTLIPIGVCRIGAVGDTRGDGPYIEQCGRVSDRRYKALGRFYNRWTLREGGVRWRSLARDRHHLDAGRLSRLCSSVWSGPRTTAEQTIFRCDGFVLGTSSRTRYICGDTLFNPATVCPAGRSRVLFFRDLYAAAVVSVVPWGRWESACRLRAWSRSCIGSRAFFLRRYECGK